MLIPELFLLLQEGQLVCWDRGHTSLAVTGISDTGGRHRPQMGCAGADVSHLVELLGGHVTLQLHRQAMSNHSCIIQDVCGDML